MAYTRACPSCHVTKEIDEFKNANGRRMFLCNPCREKFNKRGRIRYREGTDKTYAQQMDYRRALFAQPVPKGFRRCVLCLNVCPVDSFDAPELATGISKRCTGCRER